MRNFSKLSSAPKLTAGFYHAIDELNITHAWVAAPVDSPYPVKENVTVASVGFIIEALKLAGKSYPNQ